MISIDMEDGLPGETQMTHPTSSTAAETPAFNPYVPPASETPETLAAWDAEYAEWKAGQDARIASGEEPPMSYLPEFVVLLAD
ncbi:hypothetical protein ACUXK4_004584 [Methylorubrum extorquens]